MPTADPEKLLRTIANLAAQRDHSRNVDHKQNLLDIIAVLLSSHGYSDQVDSF